MKIAIISINAHTKVLNPASPLHTVCFQQFLKQNGIESTIVDYKPVYYGKFDPRHPLFYQIDYPDSDATIQKNILKKWRTLFYEREKRFDRFEEFIEKYYERTDKCYTAKILEKEDPGFDCYICVTDVIWKYNPNNGFDRGFFLACKQMDGKKKIAYAASKGANPYTTEQAKEFFDYVSDIDYISVREKSLQNYIQENSKLEVTHVLDPVFLQEKEFYDEMAILPKEKKYILIYLAMEKADNLVRTAVAYAKKHGYDVIELSEYPDHVDLADGVNYKLVYDIGVEEWLGYMMNAEYIFTNSFHACCFSIIFHKQFFVGARAGDKIDSVLELFGLEGRRVKGYAPELAESLADIDFTETEVLRKQYVKSSSDFILGAIRDLETKEHENHKDFVNPKVYTAKPKLKEHFTSNKKLMKRWQGVKKQVKKIIRK